MHNNAEEFIRKFSQVSIVDAVTKFFDEIMVLYNLIGNRNVENIDLSNNSVASFVVNMNSKEIADKVYDELNGTSFLVYNSSYDIHVANSSTESVVIVITKTPS